MRMYRSVYYLLCIMQISTFLAEFNFQSMTTMIMQSIFRSKVTRIPGMILAKELDSTTGCTVTSNMKKLFMFAI